MNIFKKLRLAFGLARKIENHPEFKRPINETVKIDGVQYYEFVEPTDMPPVRYSRMMDFIDEMNLKITYKSLSDLLTKQKEAFDTGQYTDVAIINGELLRRTEYAINFDSAYKLASCVFFNLKDNEDLTDYDVDYNEKKIEIFKREKIEGFFLKTPMKRYLPLGDLSDGDLQTYLKIKAVNERMQRLILSKNYGRMKSTNGI